MPDDDDEIVYSTAKTIPRKGKPAGKHPKAGLRPLRQKVSVRLDRKGRGGKAVTVIEGLPLQQKERDVLLKQWKSELGTGGTSRDTSIEIQGDHRDALMAALEKMGFRPARSGG